MKPNERLMSLDALRGADMLCIMGASSAVVALCALVGMPDCWLAVQMKHVVWHGFRHHDTIFPLFLFLAGVSWPFSLAGQRARGRSTAAIVKKIVVRMLLLVFLGFATAKFFSFDFANARYGNVLGHIGIGWAVAALISLFVRNVGVRVTLKRFLDLPTRTWPDESRRIPRSAPEAFPSLETLSVGSTGNSCLAPCTRLFSIQRAFFRPFPPWRQP